MNQSPTRQLIKRGLQWLLSHFDDEEDLAVRLIASRRQRRPRPPTSVAYSRRELLHPHAPTIAPHSGGRIIEVIDGGGGGGGGNTEKSWDAGILVPQTYFQPHNAYYASPNGVSVKANGDIVVLESQNLARKIYTYDGTAWDDGLALASEAVMGAYPQGIAVKANGDYLVVSAPQNNQPSKIFTYSFATNSWDNGFSAPAGATNCKGIAVKANGDIVIVGGSRRLYTYTPSTQTWAPAVALPSWMYSPGGLGIGAGDELLICFRLQNNGPESIASIKNGVWSGSIPGPQNQSLDYYQLDGVAAKANGDIVVVNVIDDLLFTYS